MAKRTISYEFRPSKRDLASIAYDLDCDVSDLTDQEIHDWVTQVLCGELAEIRKERDDSGA